MLRIISTVSFFALFVLIAMDVRKQIATYAGLKLWAGLQWGLLRSSWNRRHAFNAHTSLSVLRSLVYVSTLVLFAILAVTGFVPVIFLGKHLTGVLMVIHVTAAPFFALSLAVLALLWAHRLRFTSDVWDGMVNAAEAKELDPGYRRDMLQRICFWLIVLFSLPLMLSIILSMFPLFGTDGEEALIQIHGYSALLLALTAIIHTYSRTAHAQTVKN